MLVKGAPGVWHDGIVAERTHQISVVTEDLQDVNVGTHLQQENTYSQ